MDKYINIKENLFKLSILSRLRDGRYLISFWVNQGTAEQDLLTMKVDNIVKVSSDGREIFKIIRNNELV